MSTGDAEILKEVTQSPKATLQLPPTPPKSVDHNNDAGSDDSGISPTTPGEPAADPRYPLPPPPNSPLSVLKQDLKTPDSHVPRDPRLIRLTGVHPFNVEAPLSALYDDGFLTSLELFYVRNHGAVPRVDDATIPDWEFSIEGLVKHPITVTLRDLMSDYEQITVPITLVCAGNRRKEQNMVRKSKGFSWGSAGVSTALWTGVAMMNVLRRAVPLRGAKYVCMEGADTLPNGCYGTSVKLNWAMDPNRGLMLAYKMNGEMLRPDHGKPLRCVVPGQIGGRSVKWLKRLVVTATPSDNWYHIYDNRVLPTMVSPEESVSNPKWWTDERYAIYGLSTNSVTAYPAHDERLSLVGSPEIYKARGYAYGGDGRRISRVEITLDQGKTWALANIRYHEDEYRENDGEDEMLYGGRIDMGWRETCFTWCFWEIDLKVVDLASAGDLILRAMDESMNVQPRDIYWSVIGMMNNPWYRVTITKEDDNLHFEHPTQPALIPGGWMEKVKARGGDLTNGFWGESVGAEDATHVGAAKPEVKMTKDGVDRTIDIEELREHEDEKSPWFVVNGEVYDGTSFLETHPGGATSIVAAAAQDATDEFMAIHSETAKGIMPKYHIGTLNITSLSILNSGGSASVDTSARPIFLQPKTWSPALLTAKKFISADTRIFKFSLDYPTQSIGLSVGQHLMLRLRDPVTRDAIIRAYTPVSGPEAIGSLDILIKIYPTTDNEPGGKMTMALDSLPLGHAVDFKGPIGKFEYIGNGLCSISAKKRKVKRFIMICGGSGITPIYQVLRAVMSDASDPTTCLMVDGNRSERDILCRAEIDELVRGKEKKCKVVHALSRPPEGWTGYTGRVGKELLERELGEREEGEEAMVLICGPAAMESAMKIILKELGWASEDLLFF